MEEAAGQPHYDNMSKIQANAISDMCSADSSLNSDSKSSLAEAVMTVRWAKPEHAELVLSTLCAPDSRGAKRGRRRRDHQDFRCLHLYLSEDMWKGLLDTASSSDAKLQAILQHSLRLGLRLPTEPSTKLMCSLWLLVSCDSAELNAMDNVSKSIKLHRVKHEFNGLRLKWGDPVLWVETLPENPFVYLAKYKALYDVAFGDRSPCAPHLSGDALQAFDMSYSCRGGMKQYAGVGFQATGSGALALVPRVLPAASAASSSTAGMAAMDGMQGFQQMAVSFMQQMATSQQRMVEMMMGTTGGNPRTVSMASLHDRAEMQANRDAFTPPKLAFPPPPAASQLALERYAEEVTTPPPPKPVSRADPALDADPLQDVFELLQQRKEAGKLAAKAKAVAKVAAEAEPPSKATDKAKATAKPSAAELPAAAKAKAEPPPKAKAKIAGKMLLATAKAKIAAKAKVAAAPVLILGCGKCRWSVCGCGQCRRPDYMGGRWNINAGPRDKAP